MTPKKLSDSEKQDIVSSYTGGGVTMASLARTFGVSASTISRVLRQTGKPQASSKTAPESMIAPVEAPPDATPGGEEETHSEAKPRRKRRSRTAAVDSPAPPEQPSIDPSIDPSPDPLFSEAPQDAASPEVVDGEEATGADPAAPSDPSPTTATKTKPRRTRRRSTPRATIAPESPDATFSPDTSSDTIDIGEQDGPDANQDANQLVPVEEGEVPVERSRRRVRRRRSSAGSPPLAADPTPEESVISGREEFHEDLEDGAGQGGAAIAPGDEDASSALPPVTDLEADLLDEEDSDSSLDEDYGDDEGYDEDEGDDEGYDDGDETAIEVETDPTHPLEVSAFADVLLPNPCYLVVDRSAELITRPLKDFRELGAVPDEEADHRTLPIFDNHRIARRFSARNQRVIKVPDSTIFQKTGSYLQAKKITRLLIDGRVYSL